MKSRNEQVVVGLRSVWTFKLDIEARCIEFRRVSRSLGIPSTQRKTPTQILNTSLLETNRLNCFSLSITNDVKEKR